MVVLANIRIFVVRWLPLLLWMAAIFFVSHQPSHSIPKLGAWDVLIKKGAHFLAYAVLALLAYRVTIDTQKPYGIALIVTAVYALTDEWHQTLVPMRNGTVTDALIDGTGGAVALIIHRWQQR